MMLSTSMIANDIALPRIIDAALSRVDYSLKVSGMTGASCNDFCPAHAARANLNEHTTVQTLSSAIPHSKGCRYTYEQGPGDSRLFRLTVSTPS